MIACINALREDLAVSVPALAGLAGINDVSHLSTILGGIAPLAYDVAASLLLALADVAFALRAATA